MGFPSQCAAAIEKVDISECINIRVWEEAWWEMVSDPGNHTTVNFGAEIGTVL